MDKHYHVGDQMYVYDNRYGYCKAKIISVYGNYFTIKLIVKDRNCAYRVPSHRLLSESEYVEILEKQKQERSNKHMIAPIFH